MLLTSTSLSSLTFIFADAPMSLAVDAAMSLFAIVSEFELAENVSMRICADTSVPIHVR